MKPCESQNVKSVGAPRGNKNAAKPDALRLMHKVSVRFNDSELATLTKAAKGKPLAGYIRNLCTRTSQTVSKNRTP